MFNFIRNNLFKGNYKPLFNTGDGAGDVVGVKEELRVLDNTSDTNSTISDTNNESIGLPSQEKHHSTNSVEKN